MRPPRESLLNIAQIKTQLSRDPSFGEKGHQTIKKLSESDASGGVVFSLGSPMCRYKAAHFYEELACRYKAGAQLGRADRCKIRAECLNHKADHILAEVVKSYFQSEESVKHSLLVFADNIPSPTLKFSMHIAQAAQTNVFLVAGAGCEELCSAADESFLISSPDEQLLCSVQSVFVHALCEGLEPEYPPAVSNDSKLIERRREIFIEAFEESAALDRAMASNQNLLDQLERARDEIAQRLIQGGWLYLAGNGGSAADALELYEVFSAARLDNGLLPRVKHFLDPCYLTCAYNDGFSPFAREMERENSRDVLLVYSTSGKSENINKAALQAKESGVYTMAFSGKGGGELAKIADMSIVVPAQNTARIQEAHATLGLLLLP